MKIAIKAQTSSVNKV